MSAHREIFFIAIAVTILFVLPGSAQVTVGTPPFGSFSGGPDVINNANLNVHYAIPIRHKAGRGLNFVFDLDYDSSIWAPAGSSGNQSWAPAPYWGWQAQVGNLMPSLTYFSIESECGADGDRQDLIYYYFFFTDQMGTQHSFYFPGGLVSDPYCGQSAGTAAATDGSGYKLYASIAPIAGNVSGATITAINGEIIYPSINGQIQGNEAFQDSNGNEITDNGSTYTDTLGTTALSWTGNGTPSSPYLLTYTAPSGANASYTVKYSTYSIRTNFGCSGITEYGANGTTTANLISEIDLPDGSKYEFQYEPTPGYSGYYTGRIAQVTLPTGGAISYAYEGGSNGILCADGSTATLRRTTPDGVWSYAHSESGTAWTTTTTDPQGNQTISDFQGIYETERQVYEGSSALLTTLYTCYNGSSSPCNSATITTPITQVSSTTQWPGTNALEAKTVTTYNTYGLVTEKDEYGYGAGAPGSLGRKTVLAYANLGNNIVNEPSSVTIYDGSGNIKGQTTYTYDQGSVTTTSGTPQLTTVSGSRGNATTVTYLVQGSTTLTKTFTYFDTGNIKTSTDVNNAPSTYTYGACGNSFPTSVSEPMSLSRSMAWNCIGGVETSVTDENNNTVSWNYSSDPYFWRPNSRTDQLSNNTNLTYNGQSSVESSLVFNGGASTSDGLSTLDSLGRQHVAQVRESPSSSTYDSAETDYDSLGRPTRATLPYSGTASQANSSAPATVTTYDALGRQSQVADSGGKILGFSYVENDTYTTLGPAPSGENSKRRQYEFDALGRLTSVCEVTSVTGSGTCGQTNPATGFWTQYSYDVLNDLTNVTQSAQSSSHQTRSYSYDGLGRMVSETNPESGITNYTYDTDSTCGTSKSDLVKKVDSVGNVICYSYDALHRPIGIHVASGPYASSTPYKYFIYDSATVNGFAMANAKGRLAEAYTSASSCPAPCSSKITDEGFSYTPRGEASDIYESTPHSGGYYHLNQTYWANGAPDALSGLVGLPTVTYTPDGEGRVDSASASSGQNPLTSTTYNTASQATQVNFGSSDTDVFTYDQNTTRMTKYAFSINGQSEVGQLTWNAIGSLETLAITDPFNGPDNQTCNYTHDDLERIATVNCGSPWTQSFTYDVFGNISKSGSDSFQPTYSYLTNQMTEIGSSTPSYDANGNVTNDFLHTFQWDAAGRPIVIDASESDGVDLTYDALGRMVEQDRQGTYEQIAYAPSGTKLALMYGQSLFRAFVPLTGGAIAVYNSNGLDYYRHSDDLGSSRLASTSSRTVYYDGAYAPFGESYAETGTTDRSFTGMNQDTVSALYDYPAREYGIQGRWVSPDPAGLTSVLPTDPQSWNRYAYVRNSPLEFIDPTGQDACASAAPTGYNNDCSPSPGFDPSGADSLCNSLGCFQLVSAACQPPQCIYTVAVDSSGNVVGLTIQVLASGQIGGDTTGSDLGSGGGGAAGGGGGSGNVTYISAAPRQPWYKDSCITSALGNAALHVGIDAIGLIPDAGGISRVIGHQAGYIGVVADQAGANIIRAVGAETNTVQGLSGLSDTSSAGLLSTGLTIAGFIPGAGQIVSIASIGVDIYNAAKKIGKCH